MPSAELERYKKILAEAVLPEDATMAERRASYDELGDAFPGDETVAAERAALGGVPGWRFDPPNADPERAILYFHGGGYAMGSTKSHIMIVTRLAAAAGCRLHFPEYRLAPEHLFPAAIDDCVEAYRALSQEVGESVRIAVAGDSAGGGLVFAVMLRLRDEGLPLPACAVAISPWCDMEGQGTWRAGDPNRDVFLSVEELEAFVETYLNGENLRHPHVAPHYGDLSGLPPVLIQVGDTELLLDDSHALANGMTTAGGTVVLEIEEGAPHVWHHLAPEVPEANAALTRAGAFITQHAG
ncbi:MAG: alpha/beta hydrolase [Pseudomonadota bacterium]